METNTCGKEPLFLEVVNRKQVRLSPICPGGRFDTALPFCTTAWKLRHLPAIPRGARGVPANGSPRGGNLGAGQRKVRSVRLDSGETMPCHVCLCCSPRTRLSSTETLASCGRGCFFSEFFKRIQRFKDLKGI